MFKKIISFLCLTLIFTSLINNKSISAEENETYRIYFYNSEKWNTVYYYTWVKTPQGDKEIGSPWPGALANKEEDSDWWYIDVDLEIGTHVIFNSNNQRPQAKDLEISKKDTTYVGIVYDQETALLIEYDSKEEVEKAVSELVPIDPNTRTKIWFYNSVGWAKVYIYAYAGTFDSEPTGVYPGTLAKRDGKTHWYYYDVHTVLPVHIIFNDGSDENKAEVFVTKGVYVTINNETFMSKEEAEATIDEVKPIPEEPDDEKPIEIENRFEETTLEIEYVYKNPNDEIITIIMYVITAISALLAFIQLGVLINYKRKLKETEL